MGKIEDVTLTIGIIITIISIIGGITYYSLQELEHTTQRMEGMVDVDKCIYICMTEGFDESSEKGCLEKCENYYSNKQININNP